MNQISDSWLGVDFSTTTTKPNNGSSSNNNNNNNRNNNRNRNSHTVMTSSPPNQAHWSSTPKKPSSPRKPPRTVPFSERKRSEDQSVSLGSSSSKYSTPSSVMVMSTQSNLSDLSGSYVNGSRSPRDGMKPQLGGNGRDAVPCHIHAPPDGIAGGGGSGATTTSLQRPWRQAYFLSFPSPEGDFHAMADDGTNDLFPKEALIVMERAGGEVELVRQDEGAGQLSAALAASPNSANANSAALHVAAAVTERSFPPCPRIPIVLLLMDPFHKMYEMVQIWIDRQSDSVRDILNAIRHCIAENWKLDYDGLIQVRGPSSKPSQLIHCLPIRKYDLQRHEVLIAKPWSMSANVTIHYGVSLLDHLHKLGVVIKGMPIVPLPAVNTSPTSQQAAGPPKPPPPPGWSRPPLPPSAEAKKNKEKNNNPIDNTNSIETNDGIPRLSVSAQKRIYAPNGQMEHHHATLFLSFAPPFERLPYMPSGCEDDQSTINTFGMSGVRSDEVAGEGGGANAGGEETSVANRTIMSFSQLEPRNTFGELEVVEYSKVFEEEMNDIQVDARSDVESTDDAAGLLTNSPTRGPHSRARLGPVARPQRVFCASSNNNSSNNNNSNSNNNSNLNSSGAAGNATKGIVFRAARPGRGLHAHHQLRDSTDGIDTSRSSDDHHNSNHNAIMSPPKSPSAQSPAMATPQQSRGFHAAVGRRLSRLMSMRPMKRFKTIKDESAASNYEQFGPHVMERMESSFAAMSFSSSFDNNNNTSSDLHKASHAASFAAAEASSDDFGVPRVGDEGIDAMKRFVSTSMKSDTTLTIPATSDEDPILGSSSSDNDSHESHESSQAPLLQLPYRKSQQQLQQLQHHRGSAGGSANAFGGRFYLEV